MGDMSMNAASPRHRLYDQSFEHDSCGIGMLVNIKGEKSHRLVEDAIGILGRLAHRGGVGDEPESGDGAGILLQIPHAFMVRAAENEGFALPDAGGYGVAMMFASPDPGRCAGTVEAFCGIVAREGLAVLGTRVVPVYPECVGQTAREVCPSIRQIFVEKPKGMSEPDFERKLYVISKIAQAEIRYSPASIPDLYYFLSSISSRTIVYKGMLLPSQLSAFYLDLRDALFESSIALVHSRFSTNTFPSWERAHPIHHLIHNGEINTIRGNVNWVKAREAMLKSDRFGADLKKVMPVVNEDGSDSAMLDDFVRLLLHSGYSLAEAMMMAIPEPWENVGTMDPQKRAFYEYNSCLLEPWDGPAAIAFTDGRVAGATLDRNGLRPSRYYLTRDGTLILASEVGVLDIPPGDIVRKDRLRPGRMLLIDTEKKRIIEDSELKAAVSSSRPYGRWLAENLVKLDDLPPAPKGGGRGDTWHDLISKKRQRNSDEPYEQALLKDFVGLELLLANKENDGQSGISLLQEQKIFGYTWEDLNLTLKQIAAEGDDPVSSMGIDTPLAVLSNRPQLLYNYFKQLFAQVTNPPIDAIREQIVTSSDIQFGSEGNLLEPDAKNCRMIRHHTPILLDGELAKLKALELDGFACLTLPILFNAREKRGLQKALDDLFFAADIAMNSGYNIIVLSDRGAAEYKIPIPALLAVSGLHQHLVRKGTRTKISLIVETGEAREAHHLALLIGFGATAVCPYLAYRTLAQMCGDRMIGYGDGDNGGEGDAAAEAARVYRKAMTKTIVKIMSKMGISTVRSYHGAQIFEALGVSDAVIDRYFTGTVSRIGGVTLAEIEQEARQRHAAAFEPVTRDEPLDPGGDYKWRKRGEYHLYNPENIYYLQQACRTGSYEMFKVFSERVNMRTRELKNIRGLLRIVTADKPIPIDLVEPVESIVKRFKTGAMSYGSISQEAHECLAIAMNRLGAKSNTGEGGEMPERFAPDPDGTNRCSAIKQVASGRFGVTVHYLNNAKEIQIKMAQGAKPGEGGHLPGKKVYPWIAKARYSTPGVELISPPPHHDIYSIEDLAQLIRDLKNANRDARISVKLVSEAGVGTIAVGVAKGLADVIVISGYDGGTGAAPRTSIRHAGLPWELGVAEAHQSLLLNNMRSRVVLETDGKLMTGRDIVIAALLGAEEFSMATAPLAVMGCDMMRVCNLDTCPVGIATQNPLLRGKFVGKPEYVENFMRFVAQEIREWMARIGARRFSDLIGHVELLRQRAASINDKAKTVDLSELLYQPKAADDALSRYCTKRQDHALERALDQNTLLPLCRNAIEQRGKKARCHLPISNSDRTVGCLLSSEIARKYGPDGLPDRSIQLRFSGSAGLSFGAFLINGVEMTLLGDANDYVGKGLSGGRIIVAPPEGAGPQFDPGENIIIGNVALYGATSGELYVRGVAGERFAVRNSGATAVAEGVGEHGCEYMTGGRVAILGKTGRNFAAGMSGGVAYVLDGDGSFGASCNRAMVSLCALDAQDEARLRDMLEKHALYTGSERAKALLADFPASARAFVKVIPDDYQNVLNAISEAERLNIATDDQLLYAFNAIMSAPARGGDGERDGAGAGAGDTASEAGATTAGKAKGRRKAAGAAAGKAGAAAAGACGAEGDGRGAGSTVSGAGAATAGKAKGRRKAAGAATGKAGAAAAGAGGAEGDGRGAGSTVSEAGGGAGARAGAGRAKAAGRAKSAEKAAQASKRPPGRPRKKALAETGGGA
ncbi:MAG: glutamate synthase large subunit [Clostridiales bacterium]|nr:glutamate synthase large subunit [Clostridiales bacterium]